MLILGSKLRSNSFCVGMMWDARSINFGGLEHEFYFSIQFVNVIIPTDELIFFRGVGIPPSSKSLGYIGFRTVHITHHG